MGKKLRIQQQNSGFSLVELIIAIAILVIVTGAVCSFIIITSRNYANGNNDINVQQEAQLALNQMSDVIIDATQSINYVGYDESNQPVKALKDSEFTFTPEKKALIVYNTATPASGEGTEEPSGYADPGTPAEDSSTELHNYMFYWQKSDENLYFSMADAGGSFPMPGEVDCVLLAENVTEFQVDLSQVEERRVVKLKLNFQIGTRKFEMANNITVRNKVVINNADIEPLDKRVRVNIKVKEPVVVLEPGETFQFSTPKVTGTNLLNKNVTWKIEGDVLKGTKMLSPNRDGILQIDREERCRSFDVKVTTEAIDEESKKQAETTITVYVKRVTKVTLEKRREILLNPNDNIPGKLEVMQGSTVYLGGTAGGVNLGKKCDSCGEDPTGDGYLTGWGIKSDIAGSLQNGIQDSDHEKATIQIKADAQVGSKITIEAVSYLSSRPECLYGQVQGEITLTVVGRESTKPLPNGDLEYGKITMVTGSTIAKFTDAINSHIIAIHIVDLSTENPEETRAMLCYNNDWEIPLDPAFFGLSLNRRYAFYIQGIECVAWENVQHYYQYGWGLQRATDEDVLQEYQSNVLSNAPFTYYGTKFRSSEVYQTTLESAQATFEYGGKRYSGENIVFNTVNLLSNSVDTSNILSGLSFKKMTNVEHNHIINNMKYSVYKKNEDQWNPIYVFKGQQYEGNNNNYNGNLVIANEGNYSEPHIRIGTEDLNNVIGTYRIVPGIYFEATTSQKPQNIIWSNCEFIKSGTRTYYELPESTFYVTVTAEGTMKIISDNSDKFTGSVCFPLPAEMKNNSIFTGLEQTEWQEANIQDKNNGVEYKTIGSNNNISKIKFNRIRYRYIQNEDSYEVEPMEETTTSEGLRTTYSYGIYKWVNGSEGQWQCIRKAMETHSIITNTTITWNGENYVAYIPLPSSDDFWYRGGIYNPDWNHGNLQLYKSTDTEGKNPVSPGYTYIRASKDQTTGIYTLNMVEKTYNSDKETTLFSLQCSPAGTTWTQVN